MTSRSFLSTSLKKVKRQLALWLVISLILPVGVLLAAPPAPGGILAMNFDQDVYRPGDVGEIHFGVLDDTGIVVCGADLDLTVTDSAGTGQVLSTENDLIEITSTCGTKKAGFIEPDYQANYTFAMAGNYQFELTAQTDDGEQQLASAVTVFDPSSDDQEQPAMVVTRQSATRNYPVGATPMRIEVEFLEDFTGSLTETVPADFVIIDLSPAAAIATADKQSFWSKVKSWFAHSFTRSALAQSAPPASEDNSELVQTITWEGSWLAGETATFSYTFDAPDVSPEFYTVGPLYAESLEKDEDGIALTSFSEKRVWQIANDIHGGGHLDYIGPSSYDVSTAVFNDTFAVNAQDNSPAGMAFNNDGTKLYVVGNSGNDINEYTLSTAYDVSTGTFVDTFSVAGQETTPKGMAFNNDGTKLYVIGGTGVDINEYTLSTAFDVSTGTFVDTFSVAGQESLPEGMAFNNDGTKLYVIGQTGDDINEYTLSTAYDVSTGTFVDTFSVSTQETSPSGMAFNSDGTRLYVIGFAGDDINEYTLSTAYDVSTGTFVDSFSVSAEETGPRGMAFNSDGTKVYVIGQVDDEINEYDIDPGNYPEAAANDGSINNTNPLVITLTDDTFQDTDADNILDVGSEVTIANVPAGLTPVMTLSSSDTVVTLTFTGTATAHQNANDVADITFVFANSAFTGGDASAVTNSGSGGAVSSNVGIDFTDNPDLTYVGPGVYDVSAAVFNDTFSVATQEANPSGMAFNNDGTKVYVIGTAGDDINEYDLSTAFDVSTAVFNDTFSVATQDTVPRGMAFNNDGTKLYMIGSVFNSVYEYDLSTAYDVSTGTFVDTFAVGVSLTDMAFNNDGTKLYIVDSSARTIREYTLSTAFDVSTGTFVDTFSVSTQDTNPRDLAFNSDGTKLYVSGSTNASVYEYDLSTAYDVSTGVFIDSLSLSAQGPFPAGIEFNNDGTKLYIIDGTDDEINEYDLGPGNYPEAAANDGSINNSNTLAITLTGDTFQDTDADNILDVGSEVTIANVPAGLTPVMTLSGSDTVVTLTFTGTATSHQNSNDVADITFVFADAAFTGGSASAVTNSGSGGAFSSNVGIDFASNPFLSYIGPSSYDTSTAVFNDTFSVAAQDTNPRGMAFNNDGTKLYVVGITDQDISEYTLSTAYDVSTGTFVDTFDVSAQETSPEGMAFNSDGTKLYVIGFDGDDINEYTLSTAYDVSTGVFVDTFDVSAQETVPRGMAFNNDGTKVYVIGTTGDDVNEYTLSTAYDVSTGTFVDTFSVAAQDTNPTGMAFNNDGTKLYVVGFSGQDISEYTLSTAYDVSTGTFVDTFDVSTQEATPHGMAFNNDGTKLYVIGSTGDDVNEYDIDPGNYPEAVANDGSINNTNPLVIELDGDTFQDTDADNILDVGSEVTLANVPAGLTAVMTLSSSDTVVTLTFTGNATAHQNANDVANITFVFADSAFTTVAAANVTNSGSSGAFSSNVGIDFTDNGRRVIVITGDDL